MNYYTADLHFGHANAIKYDNRPFATVEEMDRSLIENWNARVQDEDTVYIVGDISYKNQMDVAQYLKQLKGHKILVRGNHDLNIRQNPEAMKYLDVVEDLMYIKEGTRSVVLCHYPLAEWLGYYKGTWHVYGHIHSNLERKTWQIMLHRGHALNAGCMINHYMPVTFEELIRNNELFYGSHSESEPEK